jgi:hypothetical protein
MKIEIEISDKNIRDIISGANVAYWAGQTRDPKKQLWQPQKLTLRITDVHDDGTTVTLKAEDFRRGLEVIAAEYPHHLQSILDENWDSTTGDVLIQCAMFGEIKYG